MSANQFTAQNLKKSIQENLYEYVRLDVKTLFMKTLQTVSLIVQRCLEKFDEFSENDMITIKKILNEWEKEFVTNIFEQYH